jgi:predicted DNA-binding transcriptional regulator YafY
LARSFGVFHGEGDVHVKVRFSPTVARYVEEGRWHASQKLTREKDGSVLAEFDLSSTEEIKRWVSGFGKEAEVLEPESLRQEITDELQSSLLQYRQDRQHEKKPIRQKFPGGSKP